MRHDVLGSGKRISCGEIGGGRSVGRGGGTRCWSWQERLALRVKAKASSSSSADARGVGGKGRTGQHGAGEASGRDACCGRAGGAGRALKRRKRAARRGRASDVVDARGGSRRKRAEADPNATASVRAAPGGREREQEAAGRRETPDADAAREQSSGAPCSLGGSSAKVQRRARGPGGSEVRGEERHDVGRTEVDG
ncbi:hypothetical protein BDY21DRAFT_66626 [Lineolata rhizophorae]|uniref:Uncharacterized protein n=1 Tax=Lineolata rhizophorae TaxID=578093 RepID=A0A6A6NVI5_9PEZI|nr:hypothetical protein BDY21DRAFT_66626 [Lineolata rhizophorae]